VPQLRDFLNRFRPAAAPGSASRPGIPADRAAELVAEIDPVLAMLADTQSRCTVIVSDARGQAARIGREAAEQAARIAADGRERAAAARACAANEVLASARAEAGRSQRAAEEAVLTRAGPSDADVQALIDLATRLVKSIDVAQASG